jgi:hypothetical protein
MAPGEPDIVEFYDWGLQWLFKASGVWEIARAWHATSIEVDAFYTRHRTSPQIITDREHRLFSRLRGRVERLAESPPSDSQEVPVEDNAQDSSGQQDSLTANTQDGTATFSQKNSMCIDSSTLPWDFPPTRLEHSWPEIDDSVLDYDFMKNALTDASGDFLMRIF